MNDSRRRELLLKKRELLLKKKALLEQQLNVDEGMSVGQSALQGAGQGITMGWGDELSAGLGAAVDSSQAALGMRGDIDFDDAYETRLKAVRDRDLKAQTDNPLAYGAGSAAGMIGTSVLLPGANTVRGGGALGMAAGAGASEANPFESVEKAGEFAKDAGIGLALGAGSQYGANKAADLVSGALKTSGNKVARGARELSKNRAFKAATGQNKRAFKEADKLGQLESRGADLLSSDEAGGPVVGWLSKVDDVADKAAKKKEFFGDEIGKLGDWVDQVAPNSVSGHNIRDKILDYASSVPETPKNEAVLRALLKEAEYYEKVGGIPFKEAQKLKGTYRFKPTDSTTQVLGQDATNEVRKIVAQEMDETVERLPAIMSARREAMEGLAGQEFRLGESGLTSEVSTGTGASLVSPGKPRTLRAPNASQTQSTPYEDPEKLAEVYKYLKGKYGSYKAAADTAAERALGDKSNRFISPSDYGVGGISGVVSTIASGGNPIIGAAVAAGSGAAHKFGREYGSAFAANASRSVADLLENPGFRQSMGKFGNVLEQAARRGGNALSVTHFLLMEKDPEYRKKISENQEQE